MDKKIGEEREYKGISEEEIGKADENIDYIEKTEEIPEENGENTGEVNKTEEKDVEEETEETDVEDTEESTDPPKEVKKENKIIGFIYSNKTMIKITTIAAFIIIIAIPVKLRYMTGYKYRLPKDKFITELKIRDDELYEEGNITQNELGRVDVLVNKDRQIPDGYEPDMNEMRKVDVKFAFNGFHEKTLMIREAAFELEEMFKDANRDGHEIVAISGYRSYKTQYEIFKSKENDVGLGETIKTIALPGYSEHQLGLAMDVSSKKVNYKLVESFGRTAEGKWLAENSYKYGYIIRYNKGKEDITGYNHEPWHLRYVGKKAAEEIYNRDITLEEYHGFETYQSYNNAITYDNIENFGIDRDDLRKDR